jgi:hypothetical protein
MNDYPSYPDTNPRRRKFIATELVCEYRERRALEETDRAESRSSQV